MNTDGERGHYLVLHNDVDLYSFRVVATGWGMEQVEVEDHREKDGSYEEVWLAPDGSQKLTWIEVPRVFGRFLWYGGTNAEDTVAILTHALHCETAEQIRHRLSQPDLIHDDLVTLLHLAAYVTPRVTTEVLTAFRRALEDPRRGVRFSAVRGYAIRRWPELLAAIERLAEDEPEPDIKEFAEKVVEVAREEEAAEGRAK